MKGVKFVLAIFLILFGALFLLFFCLIYFGTVPQFRSQSLAEIFYIIPMIFALPLGIILLIIASIKSKLSNPKKSSR